ncbi:MAG: tetratricopeptide repeat protein [Ferruginibacter sp.]
MNHRYKKLALLFCLQLPAIWLIAQNDTLDSLLNMLKTKQEDTTKVRLLNDVSAAYLDVPNYPMATTYANSAMSLSKKINYKKGIGGSYWQMGRVFYAQINFGEASKYYDSALAACTEAGDEHGIGKCYYGMAGITYMKGNFSEALKIVYKALKIFEKLGDINMQGYLTMRVGVINYYQQDYDEALKNFNNSLVLSRKTNDKVNIAFGEKNIGVIYFIQAEKLLAAGDTTNATHKLNASILKYKAAISMYSEIENEYGIMEVCHPFGNSYVKLGKIAEARNLPKEATERYSAALEKYNTFLSIAEKFKNDNYTAEASYAIGELYLHIGKEHEAEKHLKRGLDLSVKVKMNENIKNGYCHLAELYNKTGDYKQAYGYYKSCIQYRDSLINNETIQKAAQEKINYEVGKKEDQLKLLSTENKLKTVQAQKESQQKKIAYAGIGAVLLLGGYGFYRYTRKKRLQNKQAMTNERLRISSDLHDEVGATLSGISMYSHLVKEQLRSNNIAGIENSLQVMQQSSTQMVDKLNDIVWFINPEKDSLQQLISRLEDYAIKMAAIKDIKVNIKIPDKISNSSIHAETRRNIYLFCKEAINNAVKYSNATTLNFFIEESSGILQITVSDNGVGFEISQSSNGNGFTNMQKRAAAINGQMQLHSAKGTGTTIKLSIKITQ